MDKYQLSTLDLLNDSDVKFLVSKEEIEQKKNAILHTFEDLGIKIFDTKEEVKEKVGPSSIFYELSLPVVDDWENAKKKYSKIFLYIDGYRADITVPNPNEQIIRVEVPRKEKENPSIRSAIESEAYQNSDIILPVILGKTNMNEILVTDLTRCPHLLLAGNGDNGQRMLLDVIMLSLLYKKCPDELKFVFIMKQAAIPDCYQKIQERFCTKLPETDGSVITDVTTAISTLEALCAEMDKRYEILLKAKVRNIEEYNRKLQNRELEIPGSPLPYIVVFIEEFGDLMMICGKDFELPLCRLAQMSRAVGIHVVMATIRPTTNIITGIIKANFPARVAFSVRSITESKVVIDSPKAEKLTDYGDMFCRIKDTLEKARIVSVDEKEIEKVAGYICQQETYEPYLLPPIEDLEEEKEEDPLFEEAKRIIQK